MAEQVLRGRSAEVTAALAVLRRTRQSGQGGMILVSGDGGIGKSALLGEICHQAARQHFAVGVGRAEESDQVAPMAPLLSALRSGRSPVLSRQAFAALAPVQDQQLWLVDQVVDALEARALTGPVLVCLDDVQWADHSSVFALRVLPGRLAGSPIVWLLAARPGWAAEAELVRAVSRDLAVEPIVLGPLSPASIDQLAADRLGAALDATAKHLLAGADGVPFLAVALLDGLAARLPADRRAGPGVGQHKPVGLPDSLVLGVRARLESLPAQSVRLVRIGAVLGRSFTVEDAAALLDAPAAETVLPWLEPAVRAGVLEDSADQVVFRHDLLRQAVYEDTPASVRRALHRAAAEHMLRTGRTPLDAAAHLLRGSGPGDLAAVELLRAASRAAEEQAPGSGGELAWRAFSLLSPIDEAWGATGLEAVRALNSADGGAQAVTVADALLASGLAGPQAAAVQIEIAHLMWATGELDQIRARAEQASRLPDLPLGLRAHLLALRALSQCRAQDITGAVLDAERALADGTSSADRGAQTTALHALGEMARNDGRNDAALGYFRRMRAVSGSDYFHDEVLSLQLLDRFDEAAVLLASAQRQADEAGRSSYPPDVSFGLMWQGFSLGLLDDTETHAHSLMRAGDELKQYAFHSEARVVLCRVAQLRGDLSAAEEQLQQAREHNARDNGQLLTLQVMQAWLSHAEGDIGSALAAVRALVRPADPVRHRWLWQPGWLLPAMQMAIQGEDVALARHIAALAQTLHQHNPQVATNAAVAACAEGLATGSLVALEHAVALGSGSPRLLIRAQVTGVLGQALLADGQLDAGVATLDHAWSLYTDLGAHGEARQVQHLLQRAGIRRRRWTTAQSRPVEGWGSLTSSEQRVARLIAEGHTNRRQRPSWSCRRTPSPPISGRCFSSSTSSPAYS